MANPFGYGAAQTVRNRLPQFSPGTTFSNAAAQIPATTPAIDPSQVIDAMARQPLPYVPASEMNAINQTYADLLRLQGRYRPRDSATILFGYGANG